MTTLPNKPTLTSHHRSSPPPNQNSKFKIQKSQPAWREFCFQTLSSRMKQLAPRISLICWTLILIRAFSILLIHPSATLKFSPQEWFQTLLFIGATAGGIMLSILLARRPLRIWAFMLAAVSLFLLWTQFILLIMIQMDPRGGGLTFPAALAKWWSFSTRNALSSLTEIPFTVFILLSAVLWPGYALLYGEKDNSLPKKPLSLP
jgi:hypothetical protein